MINLSVFPESCDIHTKSEEFESLQSPSQPPSCHKLNGEGNISSDLKAMYLICDRLCEVY